MLTVLILVITLALATLGIWGMISIAISGWLDGDEESLDARLDETCKIMFPASARAPRSRLEATMVRRRPRSAHDA
jgi:hypothetical protein